MGKFRGQKLLFIYDNKRNIVWKNGSVKNLERKSGYSYQYYSISAFYADCIKFVSQDPDNYNEIDIEEVKRFYEQQFPNLKNIKITLHPSTLFGGERTYRVPDGVCVEELFLLMKYDYRKNLRFVEFFVHSKLVSSKCKIMTVREIESVSIFPRLGRKKMALLENMIYVHYFGHGFYEEKIDPEKVSLREFDNHVREKFSLDPESFVLVVNGEKGEKDQCIPPRLYHQLKAWGLQGAVENPESEEITAISSLSREGKRSFPFAYRGSFLKKEVSKRNWDQHISMESLYKVGKYDRLLKEFGVRNGSILEIFEVTGPTIPVMYCSMVGDMNVIDVNPNWNICTFLRYCGIVSGHRQCFEHCELRKIAIHSSILKDVFDLEKRRRTRNFIKVR